jgi:hypothetical protein
MHDVLIVAVGEVRDDGNADELLGVVASLCISAHNAARSAWSLSSSTAPTRRKSPSSQGRRISKPI